MIFRYKTFFKKQFADLDYSKGIGNQKLQKSSKTNWIDQNKNKQEKFLIYLRYSIGMGTHSVSVGFGRMPQSQGSHLYGVGRYSQSLHVMHVQQHCCAANNFMTNFHYRINYTSCRVEILKTNGTCYRMSRSCISYGISYYIHIMDYLSFSSKNVIRFVVKNV